MAQATRSLSTPLTRRNLLATAASAVALVKGTAVSSEPTEEREINYHDVKVVVLALEARGYKPFVHREQLFVLTGDDGCIGGGWPEDELLAMLRSYDRSTVLEYLKITGRWSRSHV